ncbi:MAG TPA: hypothetical protein VM925_35660 [Labilithrix sp.]|nr:hypothetical protein [Labilithrix sp.]
MRRAFLFSSVFVVTSAFALPAWADKIAILPFSSPNNVPRPELEEVRAWTREAVSKKGHTYATNNEMVSAEAAVRDGVADTSQEYLAAGKAVGAAWTLTGRVERHDHPPAKLPDGTEEEGYTTYRVELEAYQLGSGRLESLSREVLPDEGPNDIAEMVVLLVRPEGIANAELPWQRLGARRPKPKPKAPAPPAAPPAPPPPEAPLPPRRVYGEGHPIAIGGAVGVTNALVRPDNARGPSWAMPLGVVFGYALPEAAPGLELRGNLTGQVIGPRALELSAGARYAFAPIRDVRFFVGPELLLGAHVALGADKTARFLTHGAFFAAYGITENIQAELAADLAAALGGAGTLVLGGGTARLLVRF